jgi:hypothetical protein
MVMYCLLNDNEIIDALSERLLRQLLLKKQPAWPSIKKLHMRHSRGLFNPNKLQEQIESYIRHDLTNYLDSVKFKYKKWRQPLTNHLVNNFDKITNLAENRNYIVNLYLKSKSLGFVKVFGPQIADKNIWIIRSDQYKKDKNILLRNIKDHEDLIKFKLENNLPFWFIDSGYTNFLYAKGKPWHRIVRNHIHHMTSKQYFPADRLCHLPSFPRPWRTDGQVVLVIESSENHLRLFNSSLQQWKDNIVDQIKFYSNYKIEFRSKEMNKKIRSSVYQDLKDRDDIYCVITDSSAAAIEAVWLGIPILTLNRHITNTVSRSSIKDINDLYRGPIGNWLCELTYSQFTFDEVYDGTARKILKVYHDV